MANVRKERIGEKRMMNCGKEAEIIAYRAYDDIDIRFEDGTVVEHQKYTRFRKGTIKHPQKQREPKQKNERIGEKRMMNCGKEAEIIAYRKAEDIDVRFEDGNVVTNRTYQSFMNGQIALPLKRSRVGEKRMMNCGMEAEIIAYRSYKDIDIRFEDGVIVTHCAYERFKKGLLPGRRERLVMQRLGETRVMKNGLKATIIAYRGCHDIDVQFEDGTIVYNKSCSNFKTGEIALQSKEDLKKSRVGESAFMLCGLLAKVTEYISVADINIMFEDGEMLRHRSYTDFKKRLIGHPGLKPNIAEEQKELFHGFRVISKAFTSNKSEDRVYYNTVCETCGLIDVLTPRQMMEHAKNHLGETVRQDCGLDATVIRQQSCAKMSVVFEDGKEVTDVTWETFRTGQVHHPDLAKRDPVYAGWRIEGEAFHLNGGRVWYNVSKNGKKDVIEILGVKAK